MAAGPVRRALMVGGGTMGSGMATVFLAGDWRVDVVTPSAKTRASLPEQCGMKTGRGFYAWDKDAIAREKERCERALRKILAIFAQEGLR